MKINKLFLVLPLLLFSAFALGCDSDNDGKAQDDVGEPLNGSVGDRPSILGYEVITEAFLLDGNDCEDLVCRTEMECPSGKKLIYAGFVLNSILPPGVVPIIQNNRPFNDGSGVTFAWGNPNLPEITEVRGIITLICAFAESD